MNQLVFLVLVNMISTSVSNKHNDGLNFFVLGDWGGLPIYPYTTKIEQSVSERMSKTAEDVSPQFVLALGKCAVTVSWEVSQSYT